MLPVLMLPVTGKLMKAVARHDDDTFCCAGSLCGFAAIGAEKLRVDDCNRSGNDCRRADGQCFKFVAVHVVEV